MQNRHAKHVAQDRPLPGHRFGSPTSERSPVDPGTRRQMIAEAAYFAAEARGFAPGHELDDWLAAELRVDQVRRHDLLD